MNPETEALVELLMQRGVLPRDFADALEGIESVDEAADVIESHGQGRGPSEQVRERGRGPIQNRGGGNNS
jgi:hypothetical protein